MRQAAIVKIIRTRSGTVIDLLSFSPRDWSQVHGAIAHDADPIVNSEAVWSPSLVSRKLVIDDIRSWVRTFEVPERQMAPSTVVNLRTLSWFLHEAIDAGDEILIEWQPSRDRRRAYPVAEQEVLEESLGAEGGLHPNCKALPEGEPILLALLPPGATSGSDDVIALRTALRSPEFAAIFDDSGLLDRLTDGIVQRGHESYPLLNLADTPWGETRFTSEQLVGFDAELRSLLAREDLDEDAQRGLSKLRFACQQARELGYDLVLLGA